MDRPGVNTWAEKLALAAQDRAGVNTWAEPLTKCKRLARGVKHTPFYSFRSLEENMPGGLSVLIAYGSQNVILSGNPQMTYFYKVFKKYSHFSMENITIPLEGENELKRDVGIKLRANIPRNADLLSDLVFTFTLPDIYSKYATGRSSQWQFQWTRYIGAAIINNAAFFIGGQKIQEFDGTYLLSRALLDYDQDKFFKWQNLVGDVPELVDPANGKYASQQYQPTLSLPGQTTPAGYPNVMYNTTPTGNVQLNRPSIMGTEINIPLSFWFSESPSQSLPLVGLQLHQCEVQLTLNPINTLYTILDPSGYRVNPEFITKAPVSSLQMNMPSYGTNSDASGNLRNFLTDFGSSVPAFDGWQTFNPRLQASYIFLPKEEETVFATRPLSYIIKQVTMYPNRGLSGRSVVDLETHNPITRLIVIPRRSDWENRNDFSNYTNWFSHPIPPFVPTPGVSVPNQGSGLLVANMQEDILAGMQVLCDGNGIQERKNISFFEKYSLYQYTVGTGEKGLSIYSFQLDNSPTQPSGSINASRIRNFQVDLDLYALPTGANYNYDVDIYVESLNFLEIVSGMGGVKYAL